MPVPATAGTVRTKLEDMQIGDYIACKYTATSGVAGAFSALGADAATIAATGEISVVGEAAPSTFFYLIKVDTGMLISDRVVQHSVAWNTLNEAKMIQGCVLNAFFGVPSVRSLTGGVAFMGADGLPKLTDQGLGAWPSINEWDTYIVNSNLNGKITAGDDNVWHWNHGTSAWCADTPIIGLSGSNNSNPGVSSNRIHKGLYVYGGTPYGGLKGLCNSASNTVVQGIGFRPVFEYMEPNSKASNLFY